MKRAIAAALIALSPVSLAASAGGQKASAAPHSVRIAFAPPVSTPIRYRLTETDMRPRGPYTTVLDLTVRFDKAPGGYRMSFDTTLPPSMRHLERVLILTRMPHSAVLLLNDQGPITGVEDESGYWSERERRLGRNMSAVAGAAGGKLGPQLASFEVARYRTLPAQTRYALIAQNVSPIIDLASTTFEPGRTVERRRYGMTPFTIPTEQVVKADLTGISDREATVAAVRETPAAEIERLFAEHRRRLESIGLTTSPPTWSRPPSVVDRITYRVSPSTGLTSSYESRRILLGEAGGSVRTIMTTTKLEQLSTDGI